MVVGRGWWARRKETRSDQLPREIDAASAGTVGEKAVITDADQSRGQHMQQEAAQELVDIDQQTPETTRERRDRHEERGLGNRAPLPAVNRKAAARHDAMDVRVQGQGLSPGVQYTKASRLDVKAALSDVDQGSSGTVKTLP